MAFLVLLNAAGLFARLVAPHLRGVLKELTIAQLVRFGLSRSQISALERGFRQAEREARDYLIEVIRIRLRAAAPYKTGRLRRSIRVRRKPPVGIRINMEPYGFILNADRDLSSSRTPNIANRHYQWADKVADEILRDPRIQYRIRAIYARHIREALNQ